ncbi:MAG: hypothetical protein IIA81_07365 [Thaumarchaeota archaeon]|nr:hypothetical protein [Nitrososphaerota archaeon]
MKHKISRIGLLTVIPLLLIAFVLLPISEADAFESEENIIQISNSTLELVSGEEYITPIIVIISIEQ